MAREKDRAGACACVHGVGWKREGHGRQDRDWIEERAEVTAVEKREFGLGGRCRTRKQLWGRDIESAQVSNNSIIMR